MTVYHEMDLSLQVSGRNWLARPTVTGFGHREVDSSILSGDDFLAVVL